MALHTVVPQRVAKIPICNCPMASGNYLVTLINKIEKMGGSQFGYDIFIALGIPTSAYECNIITRALQSQ